MGLSARSSVSQRRRLGRQEQAQEQHRSEGTGWPLCHPEVAAEDSPAHVVEQRGSHGAGGGEPGGSASIGMERGGGFLPPSSINREADVAPPPPKRAEMFSPTLPPSSAAGSPAAPARVPH